MSRIALLSLLLSFSLACTQSPEPVPPAPFSLDLRADPTLEFENLRLVPVVGQSSFLQEQENLGSLIGLEQALAISRFRITEKKPYGRFQDTEAVNQLSVQNKTDHAVYLLAGEVIRGGKQDRILAEDRVIAPRSITDLAVFCVEEDRWEYRQAEGVDTSPNRQEPVFAFRGYYQMASRDLRWAATRQRDQQEVWKQVAEIRNEGGAVSDSKGYAALEEAAGFSDKKRQYETYFRDKLLDQKGVIGFVGVSGNRILGMDLMGNPELFRQQYPALLAGYITDAITRGSPPELSPEALDAYAADCGPLFHKGKKLMWQGQWIHFHDL